MFESINMSVWSALHNTVFKRSFVCSNLSRTLLKCKIICDECFWCVLVSLVKNSSQNRSHHKYSTPLCTQLSIYEVVNNIKCDFLYEIHYQFLAQKICRQFLNTVIIVKSFPDISRCLSNIMLKFSFSCQNFTNTNIGNICIGEISNNSENNENSWKIFSPLTLWNTFELHAVFSIVCTVGDWLAGWRALKHVNEHKSPI